eukprot:g12771.t1
MGAGASISKEFNARLQEELKKSASTKVEDIEDHTQEVRRLRKIIHDGCKALEEEKARQEELDRRVSSGKVQIVYQQYRELFEIENGKLLVAKIDEDYCLSDVMPGCKLALLNNMSLETMHKLEMDNLPVPFQPKVELEDSQEAFDQMYTYADEPRPYTVVVYEDPEQYKKDMEKVKARIAADTSVVATSTSVERVEGCSCLEGNPCTDGNKYNCKDWDNRFAVAKKNGWSG